MLLIVGEARARFFWTRQRFVATNGCCRWWYLRVHDDDRWRRNLDRGIRHSGLFISDDCDSISPTTPIAPTAATNLWKWHTYHATATTEQWPNESSGTRTAASTGRRWEHITAGRYGSGGFRSTHRLLSLQCPSSQKVPKNRWPEDRFAQT